MHPAGADRSAAREAEQRLAVRRLRLFFAALFLLSVALVLGLQALG